MKTKRFHVTLRHGSLLFKITNSETTTVTCKIHNHQAEFQILLKQESSATKRKSPDEGQNTVAVGVVNVIIQLGDVKLPQIRNISQIGLLSIYF